MPDSVNGLIFSEFLVDNPWGFDTDGDGTANKSDEFIELQNTTGNTISLDGYELWSDDAGLLYAFGPGDTVDPGQTATIVGEYTGAPPAGFYDSGRSEGNNWLQDGEGNKNDTVYLVDTASGGYIAFSYGNPAQPPSPPPGFPGTSQSGTGESINSTAPNDISFVRDADGDWVESASPEPGSPGVVCFAAGTMIATPDGDRPVENLQVGHLVITLDGRARPILWAGTRTIGPEALADRPELRPIALEPRWTGCRERLLLSGQHAVLIRSPGDPQGRLARALQLARMKGGAVRTANGVRKVTYVHFMLPSHEVVFAHGLAVETFYPGAWAIKTLAPHSQLTLLAAFPGCDLQDIAGSYGPPKRPYARKRDLGTRLAAIRPVNIENPSCSTVQKLPS
ncbi:MAG: Hint domain-containing protein [Pseudomonadota bacterium]